MENNGSNDSLLLIATSLTKLHPGSGRSPGVVDLPIVRDPMGYPFIPGSMIKGSLKTVMYKRYGNNNTVKCLFGPEPGDPEKFAGALTVSDVYPLFIPAPSTLKGMVYVTSNVLLSRAYELARTIIPSSDITKELEQLSLLGGDNVVFVGKVENKNEIIRIGTYHINIEKVEEQQKLTNLKQMAESLHVLYKSVPINERIVILPEEYAIPIIESLLMRITRVRIDRITKTVEAGSLWTEEYLPWGILFVGGIIDNKFRGDSCNNKLNPANKLMEELGKSFTIVVGGKETVGGGVLKINLYNKDDN